MNKKLTAFIIAVFLLLSCGFCVFAVPALGIGDIIDIITSVDTSKYTSYSEQEWTTMSASERLEQINFVISDQKGKSYITETSDFINDSSLSYKYYSSLIDTSPAGVGSGWFDNIFSKQYLENNGLADFGMGYYNGIHSGGSGGHFSGKFGEGTVADTLNDEFLDYIQKYPYSGNSGGSRYLFPNGYIIDWEPLYFQDGSPITVTGSPHSTAWYYLRFYLYDDTGVMINTFTQKSYPDLSCLSCGTLPFDDLTVTDDGYYYYTYPSNAFTHIFDDCTTPLLPLPWYSSYGSPVPVSDDIPAIGVDDKGTTIDFNINSDGVTYEGNTYNYNDDNSVTINGNTYHITVDPSTVNQNYYNEFLNNFINNYNNYYNSTATPFDDTDILSHLKSIFSSLERFRGDVYSYIRQIYTTVHDGFNSLRSLISTWGNKIVKAINSLGGSSDLSDEDLYYYNEKLQKAIYSRFAPVISLSDLVNKALSAYKSSTTSSIDFKLNGFSYSIDFSTWFNNDNLSTIRYLMAAFIYVTYALNTYRRIPSYIYNGGDR